MWCIISHNYSKRISSLDNFNYIIRQVPTKIKNIDTVYYFWLFTKLLTHFWEYFVYYRFKKPVPIQKFDEVAPES